MTNWSRRQKLQIKNISTINKFARYFRLQNKPSSGAKREITKALCYFVGLVNLALLRQRNIFICIFSFFVCFFCFWHFLFRTSFFFSFIFSPTSRPLNELPTPVLSSPPTGKPPTPTLQGFHPHLLVGQEKIILLSRKITVFMAFL